MRRLLENRITLAAILVLFAAAFAWNTAQGAGTSVPWHQGSPKAVAQQPIAQSAPDGWQLLAADHGPGIPPDPWDQCDPSESIDPSSDPPSAPVGPFVPWSDPSQDPWA